jgi:hypothetical protein
VRGPEEDVAGEAVDQRLAPERRQPRLVGLRPFDPRAHPGGGGLETHHVDAGEGHDEEERRGQQSDSDAPEEAEGGGHR